MLKMVSLQPAPLSITFHASAPRIQCCNTLFALPNRTHEKKKKKKLTCQFICYNTNFYFSISWSAGDHNAHTAMIVHMNRPKAQSRTFSDDGKFFCSNGFFSDFVVVVVRFVLFRCVFATYWVFGLVADAEMHAARYFSMAHPFLKL